MKKLITLLVVLTLCSCNNIISENIIVSKIEFNEGGGTKYKVYLNSYYGETILLTDKVFTVGDTLK